MRRNWRLEEDDRGGLGDLRKECGMEKDNWGRNRR